MQFYRFIETQSAQVQAVGASLQIGSTIWGAYPDSWNTAEGRRKNNSAFIGRVIIMAPECSRGLRVAFELRTPWFTLKRIGKVSEEHDASQVGWHIARRMCSGVNI